jgi:hypothetical protein
LRELHGQKPAEPARGQRDVTIELMLDDDWHQRRQSNDGRPQRPEPDCGSVLPQGGRALQLFLDVSGQRDGHVNAPDFAMVCRRTAYAPTINPAGNRRERLLGMPG